MNDPTILGSSDAWLSQVIVGASPAILRLRVLVRRIARTQSPVLIIGPTGSGKELVAEAIHRLSGRAGQLVSINICAVGESMFETMLFGHLRGAFTGAVGDVAGVIQEANGGTLFLDEIGALGVREQAKLLRVLETRVYRPLGAARDRVSDFRLVSATNEPPDEAVATGHLREDLLYRLRGFEVRLPPLAERRADIPLLVHRFAADSDGEVQFDSEAMATLVEHAWPGNVRELRSVVANLATLSEHGVVRGDDVRALLRAYAGSETRSPATNAARDQLVAMLEDCGWDTARVAERLGVHRVTVYGRMRVLGIERSWHGRNRGDLRK